MPVGSGDPGLFDDPKSEREIAALAEVMRETGFTDIQVEERTGHWRAEWAVAYAPYVVVDSEIMAGLPTFRGTHVVVGAVIDEFCKGLSVGEILATLGTLDRSDVEAVLEIWRRQPAP